MRRITLLGMAAIASASAGLAVTGSSFAAGKKDWVCWMQPSGETTCGALSEPYHVRDIPYKPHKHPGTSQPCRHCTTNDFKLTHPNIHDFGNYVNNATMRRHHDAAMYGSKVRGIRD